MDRCTLMVSNWEIAALKTKSKLYNNNKKETKGIRIEQIK